MRLSTLYFVNVSMTFYLSIYLFKPSRRVPVGVGRNDRGPNVTSN